MNYYMDIDNGGHWYIIPVNKKNNFEQWLELDPNDEESRTAPEYVKEIDGPHVISFSEYEEINQ